jgi:hypothetical protein
MNLERAGERACSVRARKGAARLYNDIEYELALGEHDDCLEDVGEQALALLEDRFPGVREAARQIEEPPSLSCRAGAAFHGIERTVALRPRIAHGRKRRVRSQLSWRWVYAYSRAHPMCAVTMIAVATIVLVNVWAYIVLGLIAVAALKSGGHGRRTRGRRQRS